MVPSCNPGSPRPKHLVSCFNLSYSVEVLDTLVLIIKLNTVIWSQISFAASFVAGTSSASSFVATEESCLAAWLVGTAAGTQSLGLGLLAFIESRFPIYRRVRQLGLFAVNWCRLCFVASFALALRFVIWSDLALNCQNWINRWSSTWEVALAIKSVTASLSHQICRTTKFTKVITVTGVA